MKAFYLTQFGAADSAFDLREAARPAVMEHQVLIEVEAFGLNFADVLARKGLYPEVPERPCIIGYEVVGKVVELGSKADKSLLSKRVVAMTRFGGYAQYAATDFRAVAPIADDYPAAKALALATQYSTAHVCMHEHMRLRPGDKVLVHAAAGGVGIALCQMALKASCTVFGTAGSPAKIEFLKKLGVHHPINYREKDYEKEVRKLLDGDRLAASFNSLAGSSVGKDLRLLGSGGSVVVFGAASRVGKKGGIFSSLGLLFKTGFISPLSLIMRSKSIAGVNLLKLGDYKPQVVAEAMQAVVKAAEAGDFDPVVGGSYPSSALHEAHAALENRSSIGKLSVFWEE